MFRNSAKSQRYHATSPGGNARTRSPDIQVLVSTLELPYLAYLNPTCCKLVNDSESVDQRVSLADSLYLSENRSVHRHGAFDGT